MERRNKIKRASQAKTKNHHNLTQSLNELVDKLLRLSTVPQPGNVAKALDHQKEIGEVTSRIRGMEKTSKNSVDNRATSATVDAFLNWAREHGALLEGCTLAEFEGFELGLRADVDIEESKLVIAVPRKLMMSVENARESEMRGLMEEDMILGSMPNVALAVFLLMEKFKGDSFWKPYIDILPKSYTTVLYFTVEELEELKGSPTLEVALKQIKSISRQYAYFHKLFATSNDPVSKMMRHRFTFDEYCWAVSTVMTRQNTIPYKQDLRALIPLWDMCNHTNGTISTDFNPSLDRLECLALRNFNAGEQFFICYGTSRSNADFFIHNGFVYEDNENDLYWLKLGISKSDPLQEKRSQLLDKLSIATNADFAIKKGPKPVEGQLLAFVRVFNMSEEQLDCWLKSERCGDLQYSKCALDTSLGKKSLSFLQARLRLLLSSYKTTLEDDEKLIAEVKSWPNRLLAIRMRATEKRIIRDTLDYLEQCIRQ